MTKKYLFLIFILEYFNTMPILNNLIIYTKFSNQKVNFDI